MIDAPRLMEKLAKIEAGPTPRCHETSGGLCPTTWRSLVVLRRRIKLDGNGPRGVAVIGTQVYAAEYFTDTLAWWIWNRRPPSRLRRSPWGRSPQLTDQRRGEMLFNDATICFQHWQSCEAAIPTPAWTA